MTPSSREARAQLVTLLGTLFAQIDGPATLGEHADWLIAHGVTLTPAAPREPSRLPSVAAVEAVQKILALYLPEWRSFARCELANDLLKAGYTLDHPTHEGPPHE